MEKLEALWGSLAQSIADGTHQQAVQVADESEFQCSQCSKPLGALMQTLSVIVRACVVACSPEPSTQG